MPLIQPTPAMPLTSKIQTTPAWLRVRAQWAVVLLPLLLLWQAPRHAIESRMAMHMLLEFPILLAGGWCLQRVLHASRRLRGPRRAFALLDWRGWTGATLASLVAITWMIPSALDVALLSEPVAAVKYASWWIAGFVLAGSWRRMDSELLLFFVGNLAWMLAAAGMLYLDAPARLCVSYLVDDQRVAGIGLIAVALALGAFALRSALSRTAA
jgi:hypothetical protein